MATISLTIDVENLAEILSTFTHIKVYRSTTGVAGPFTELTTTSTRIALLTGVDSYAFVDTAGDPDYWYKTSFFNSTTTLESSLSDPILGDDPSIAGIMTVSDVKELYLFGLDLTNDAGEPFPDRIFEWGIRSAIASIERKLDIRVRPTTITAEKHDYRMVDYQNWMFLQLREFPVLSVEKVSINYPTAGVVEFPDEWIRLQNSWGQVHIIPAQGTISGRLITGGGAFLPLVTGVQGRVPQILQVDYTAGFPEGRVPYEIRDLIGKMAAFAPLNIAGDLIVGAGIASKSISIDGLSQSINTTSSATNAGYGARLTQYAKEIKDMIPTLQRYYKGIGFTGI